MQTDRDSGTCEVPDTKRVSLSENPGVRQGDHEVRIPEDARMCHEE